MLGRSSGNHDWLLANLAYLAVFVHATHTTQAIVFEWKPGFMLFISLPMKPALERAQISYFSLKCTKFNGSPQHSQTPSMGKAKGREERKEREKENRKGWIRGRKWIR